MYKYSLKIVTFFYRGYKVHVRMWGNMRLLSFCREEWREIFEYLFIEGRK